MTEFNKGWWNCFISAAEEMGSYHVNSGHIEKILGDAGIRKCEIDDILLREPDMPDTVKKYLSDYKNLL